MKPTRRILMVAVLALAGLQVSGCAYRSGLIDCPSNCDVNVTLPGGGRPPSVPDNYVRVKPGTKIDFVSAQPVVILFPAGTPFVDGGGDPVYWFQANGSTTLDVRNDSSKACTNWRGCKYIVYDPNNPERPPLDPYIIIDR